MSTESGSTHTARIRRAFERARSRERAALIGFLTAGDPDPALSHALMCAMPAAGVDIIELGMPFSDPQADGPTIQRASQRALVAGQTMAGTLGQVARFRQDDTVTPVILMGYYNPIYRYGRTKFLHDAHDAGVDGMIVVDLPPEHDDELCLPAQSLGLCLIRLATPTSDEARLRKLSAHASGFVYYVTIKGITGTTAPNLDAMAPRIRQVRSVTGLPVAAGFGITTPAQAAVVGKIADGIVVGSVIVREIERAAHRDEERLTHAVVARVRALGEGLLTATDRAQRAGV